MARVNVFKRAVFDLMEKAMIKYACVLEVRKWQSGSICEIDLHTPDIDMSEWKIIQRLKCKVDDYEYRDYTPSLWHPEKKICTLFVGISHDGYGSNWAKNIQKGDKVLYGAAIASKLPARPGRILCFGDSTSIAHYLSMEQLLDNQEYPMDVSIILDGEFSLTEFWKTEHPQFEFANGKNKSYADVLINKVRTLDLTKYTSICLTGNTPMIKQIRNVLKSETGFKGQILNNAFWC